MVPSCSLQAASVTLWLFGACLLPACFQPRPSTTSTPTPSATHHAAPKSASRPAEKTTKARTPLPPRLQFGRRFSPPLYPQLASRSLYTDGLARQVAAATVTTKLHAIEVDWLRDDNYYRDGELVLLSRDGDVVTAFASRCYVDITYPTSKLYVDGVGGTEWGPQALTLTRGGEKTKSMRLVLTEERPQQVPEGKIVYRTLGDNDTVILYFNQRDLGGFVRSQRDLINLPDPDASIEEKVRDATNIFGQEYLLVSKTCYKMLKDAVPQEDILGELLSTVSGRLLGMVITVDLFKPLFGPASGFVQKQTISALNGILTDVVRDFGDALERRNVKVDGKRISVLSLRGYAGRRIANRAEPIAVPEEFRIRGAVLGPGGLQLEKRSAILGVMNRSLISQAGLNPRTVQLLGVTLPAPGSEEGKVLADFLRQVAGSSPVQYVRFSEARRSTPHTQTTRGMLFLPRDQLTINHELIRHGLVRLDVTDASSIRSFPELAQAANAALREGLGFAGRWKNDSVYTSKVLEALQSTASPMPTVRVRRG